MGIIYEGTDGGGVKNWKFWILLAGTCLFLGVSNAANLSHLTRGFVLTWGLICGVAAVVVA